MGLLDRFSKKSPSSPAGKVPDVLAKEIATYVKAIPAIKHLEVTSATELRLWYHARQEPYDFDITPLRDAVTGQNGMDRIDTIDDILNEIRLPPDSGKPNEDLADIADDGTVHAPVHAPIHEQVHAPVHEPVEAAAPIEHSAPVEPAATAGSEPAGPVWPDIAPRLLPCATLATEVREGQLRWPITESLVVTVALDGFVVTEDEVARWDVGPDDVWSAAMEALVRTGPELEPVAPGLAAWAPTGPDGHQAAWIACPGAVLRAVGLERAVAFAATPRDLVVCDAADTELVAQLTQMTAQIFEAGEGTLSPAPVLLTGDGVGELDRTAA